MTWHGDDPETQRWAAIAVGLLAGIFAKYAFRLQDHKPIRWRHLLIDILLLAGNALLASIAVTRLNLHGQEAMAVAALFGASSDRIVRLILARFETTVEKTASVVMASAGESLHLPASDGPVEVQMAPVQTAAAPIERLRDLMMTKRSPEADAAISALLAKLDGGDAP